MLPSRRYEPTYPPARNAYGQNVYQVPPQHIQQQQQQPQHLPQQQQIQQQQQQHEIGQPNGGQQMSVDGQSAMGGPGGQEMNLASVLHYLQSEWRRWERDRNEWEIERAEMRARIALLEGQRRSAENLKVDLLRRVKMLEFALRQERTRATGTVGTMGSKASGIAPSKLASLQEDDRSSNKDEKEGSDSGGSGGGSDERDDDRSKPNGNHAGTSKSSVSSKTSDSGPWKNIGSVPRDPKSRARSREYLKQCLQEITYLTSPGALNPLPNRPLLSDLEQSSPQSGPVEPEPERPIKALPSKSIPSQFTRPKEEEQSAGGISSALPNGIKEEPVDPTSSYSSTGANPSVNPSVKPSSPSSESSAPKSHLSNITSSDNPPSSPHVRTKGLPDTDDSTHADVAHQEHTNELLTAIYRPESKAAWREELRAAHEKASRSRQERTPEPSTAGDEQLSSISLDVNEEEVPPDQGGLAKTWTSRKSLKSHLDSVRSVAISSSNGASLMLASGGDDNTVKIWSVDASSVLQNRGSSDIEPIATYRGHTASVTSVLVNASLKLVISASLDSTIRLWTLPEPSHDPYAPYDASTSVQTLVGHSEAIWDLCILPSRSSKAAKDISPRLASCSADGTVKIWVRSAGSSQWTLDSSIGGFPDGAVPTCLGVYQPDYNKILVGFTNGKIGLYDIESRQEVASIGAADTSSHVNSVLSHPTLPIIIGGYEDGHMRIYDSEFYALKEDVLAHPEAVTSLALSPLTPTSVITSSANCEMRVWDLTKNVSTQDLGGHRARGGEGICQVAAHPDLAFLASAGADGMVRLWHAA